MDRRRSASKLDARNKMNAIVRAMRAGGSRLAERSASRRHSVDDSLGCEERSRAGSPLRATRSRLKELQRAHGRFANLKFRRNEPDQRELLQAGILGRATRSTLDALASAGRWESVPVRQFLPPHVAALAVWVLATAACVSAGRRARPGARWTGRVLHKGAGDGMARCKMSTITTE